MKTKYYVAVEASMYHSVFGGFPGFSIMYFEVNIAPPVTAEALYRLINDGKEDKDKTGRVIAWSKIED